MLSHSRNCLFCVLGMHGAGEQESSHLFLPGHLHSPGRRLESKLQRKARPVVAPKTSAGVEPLSTWPSNAMLFVIKTDS